VIFVVFFSIFTLKKTNLKEIVLLLMLMTFGLISFSFGMLKGHDVNIRGVVAPLIFMIVVNSKSHLLLKPLFVISIMFLVVEYISYYSNNLYWTPIVRFGMLRPFGLFFNTTITSLFIALSLYTFGWKFLGGVVSIIMMSLQTPFTYIILYFNKLKIKNIIFASSFAICLYLLLNNIGHLDPNYEASMISTYVISIQEGYHECYLYGCATNAITFNVSEERYISRIADNGILRSLYFFGPIWIFLYFILILRKSKNKLFSFVYLLSILHYAVVFGVLGAALIGIHINYINRYYYKDPI
jgi:hypothetical protein